MPMWLVIMLLTVIRPTTTFWVDRKEHLTAVLMVQTPGGPLRADFQNAVMQAIVD